MIRYLLIILSAACSFSSIYAQGINFSKGSFRDITELVKQKDVPIFIDVYTEWCGPCKKLSREVFPDTTVGRYFNEHFVNYQFDAEQGEGISLAKKYGVTAYPSLLWVDKNGNLIYKVVGFKSAEKLLESADLAIREFKDPEGLRILLPAYESKKNDPLYLQLLIEKLSAQKISYQTQIEQYASLINVQTGRTREVMDVLLKYTGYTIFGDKAYEIVKGNRAFYASIANDTQLDVLNRFDDIAGSNTFRLALSKKDESLLDVFLLNRSAKPDRMFDRPEDIRLDFYMDTKKPGKYQPMAKKYLDSLCRTVDPKIAREKDNEAFAAFEKKKRLNEKNLSPAALARLTEFNRHTYSSNLGNRIIRHASEYFSVFKDKASRKAAINWISQALELNPENPEFLSAYATVLYLDAQQEKALTYMQKACDLSKDNSRAKENLLKKLENMKNNQFLDS